MSKNKIKSTKKGVIYKKNPLQEILKNVPETRGILWEKILELEKQVLNNVDGAVHHKAGEKQSKEMKETYPLIQHIENGMYTRQIFMPKGHLVISMVHKQNHPSFLLKGELSYLADNGDVIRIKGPHVIQTKQGTQRVLYIHKDCHWACVYRTEAETNEEAEADVYTNDYKELPKEIIEKNKKLWQELAQQPSLEEQ